MYVDGMMMGKEAIIAKCKSLREDFMEKLAGFGQAAAFDALGDGEDVDRLHRGMLRCAWQAKEIDKLQAWVRESAYDNLAGRAQIWIKAILVSGEGFIEQLDALEVRTTDALVQEVEDALTICPPNEMMRGEILRNWRALTDEQRAEKRECFLTPRQAERKVAYALARQADFVIDPVPAIARGEILPIPAAMRQLVNEASLAMTEYVAKVFREDLERAVKKRPDAILYSENSELKLRTSEGDTFTFQDVENAVTVLREAHVPPCDDGFYRIRPVGK